MYTSMRELLGSLLLIFARVTRFAQSVQSAQIFLKLLSNFFGSQVLLIYRKPYNIENEDPCGQILIKSYTDTVTLCH